jgi:hypothetical protein
VSSGGAGSIIDSCNESRRPSVAAAVSQQEP